MIDVETFKSRLLGRCIEVEGPLDTPCWCWQGSCLYAGYGQIWWKGEKYLTHRASWEVHYGPIPNDAYVLHRCDVPGCCNPEHLFIGDAHANTLDCISKGRFVSPGCKGEANGIAKLTSEDVQMVWAMFSQGYSKATIARKLKVHHGTVSKIIRGESWRHVIPSTTPVAVSFPSGFHRRI